MQNFYNTYRWPLTILACLCLLALSMTAAARYLHTTIPALLGLAPKPAVHVTAILPPGMPKPLYLNRSGTVEAAIIAPLTAEMTSSIVEVLVTEGQTVQAGQALMRLKNLQPPTPAPAPAPSTPSASRQLPAGAAAPPVSAAQAETNYENALKDYTRAQKLYEIGAISRVHFEQSTARMQAAKEALNKLQAADFNTAAAPGTISNAGGPPVGTIFTITAPSSGKLVGRLPAVNTVVQTGQPLCALGSGNEFEALIPLNQNDLYILHLGTPVLVDISGQKLTGQVNRIDPVITNNALSGFVARVSLNGAPAGLLRSGLTAALQIDTQRSALTFSVPATAILTDSQGRTCLYVADNGKARLLEVTVSATSDDIAEISAGLTPSSLVITSGLTYLQPDDDIIISLE